jgi:hypothetical protein
MAMRGDCDGTVGERELMAAMTAKWNACEFRVQGHRLMSRTVDIEVATKSLERLTCSFAWSRYRCP